MISGSDNDQHEFHSVETHDIHSLSPQDSDLNNQSGHLNLHNSEQAIVHEGVLSEVAKFFSFRNIVYFAAFFGLTGTILKVTNVGDIISFICSLGIGFFSAGFGYSLMKYLRNNESGESLNIFDLNGKEAKVSIGISKSRKGKIVVESGGSSLELTALLSENADEEFIPKGKKVLIIEINKETAFVVKSDL
jgi:hypothetical protein